jgi:hypothetical protein
MSNLWVKFENKKSTQVSTADCQNVDDFLEACKNKLSPLLDHIPVFELTLSTTDSTLELFPYNCTKKFPYQVVNVIIVSCHYFYFCIASLDGDHLHQELKLFHSGCIYKRDRDMQDGWKSLLLCSLTE